RSRSREAIGVRRTVAALEPDLMRSMALRPVDEEIRVEGDAAAWIHVELHHPAVDAFGVELRIDRAVERVGEIDALAVAADLDHLRAAVERSLGLGMAGPRHDPADADLAGELGGKGIAHVILK